MDLKYLQQTAWEIAHSKRLHEHLDTIPVREATLVRLALIHTEVSKAVQIVKRHSVARLGELAEELAGVLIRVADMAEELGIDLSQAVALKLEINRHRPMYYGTPQEVPHALEHPQDEEMPHFHASPMRYGPPYEEGMP